MAEIQNDNSGDILRKMNHAVERALRLMGGAAERYAKENVRDMEAVDTGFLRNSITWALDGEMPDSDGYHDDAGKQEGEYNEEAPAETGGNRAVYIGTNVYYAPYVEIGTTRMIARPFLENAITQHTEEYERLCKEAFDYYF